MTSNKMFILSFSVTFVCLVVILLILCHPSLGLGNSSLTSDKELNPSPQKDSSSQGILTWHTNFTLSCVNHPWDSPTAYFHSSKELVPSSLEDTKFSRRCNFSCKFYSILSCVIPHKTLKSRVAVYHKEVPDYAPSSPRWNPP